MINFFYFLLGVNMLAIPNLLIAILIRSLRKKSIKKLKKALLICFCSVLPLTILCVIISPSTWCEHEYKITDEIAPSCLKNGEIHRYCSLCENEEIEYIDALGHSMKEISRTESTQETEGKLISRCTICEYEKIETLDKLPPLTYTESCEHEYKITDEIAPSCLKNGEIHRYCSLCENKNIEYINALGHSMKEVSRTESTQKTEGKIVSRCTICEYEKIETLDKLPPLTYIEGVEYKEIYLAYKENPLRADDNYKNNRYRITAKINGITNNGLFNLTGGATLTMETRINNTIVFFLAEFEKEQEENLKTINVGDTITFEGECLSDEMWVECELIN